MPRTIDHNQVCKLLLENPEMSFVEAAKILGCTSKSVSTISRKFGIRPYLSTFRPFREPVAPPDTAVEVDGYLLLDEEAARRFRHISAHKKIEHHVDAVVSNDASIL